MIWLVLTLHDQNESHATFFFFISSHLFLDTKAGLKTNGAFWPSWRMRMTKEPTNDVMNGYLGKDDLTFVFSNTFAYEFSNFSHKHTRATVSQVHVVLCSRWVWRLKKYPFSVTKLIVNFSEQSQIESEIVVTNHMSISSTHI